MFDYGAWLDRATRFIEKTRNLNGVSVEGKAYPPISNDQFEKVAATCRLPIPRSLRELWTSATSYSDLRFHWRIPAAFGPQLKLVTQRHSNDYLTGGPEFVSYEESVELANQFIEWIEVPNYAEYPRDCRYWANSFPIIPDGTGDFIGLYVRDEVEDPPVVYLCHEAYGGSRIIAPNLATFPEEWEKLCFIEVDFVSCFLRLNDSQISVDDFPVQHEAINAMFRGEVRDDLKAPPIFTTEQQWRDCLDADRIVDWETDSGKTKLRKLRHFNCACAKRYWSELGKTGQNALTVSEAFADGNASQAELDSARDALSGGVKTTLDDPAARDSLIQAIQQGAEELMEFAKSLGNISESAEKSIAFQKSEGSLQHIGYSLIDNYSSVSEDITHHFDGDVFETERRAHANLARHIFGNPWQRIEHISIHDAKILDLARRLYAGEKIASELASELQTAGYTELVEHFRHEPDHPGGCWALDYMLGRD